MKFHGIDILALTQSEIAAGRDAMDLLRDLKAPLYATDKEAWRILARAQTYLADFIRPRLSSRIPRTFNRDLVYPVKKDADGNRLCRWDQKPVPRKRMSYCSEACRIEVDIRTSAGSLRYHVKQRDKGVCAECGLDTAKLKRILEHAARSYYELQHGIGSTNRGWWSGEFSRESGSLLVGLGFNRSTSLWEADHILEVVDGGESTLENTQTLCVPCHKAKTARQAGERARARREAKQPRLVAA